MACYAPVFKPNSIFACVLRLIYLAAIAGIMIATLFLCPLCESCWCTIKQYQFRIKYCTKGNDNSKLEI